jgi:hypothetical protein
MSVHTLPYVRLNGKAKKSLYFLFMRFDMSCPSPMGSHKRGAANAL